MSQTEQKLKTIERVLEQPMLLRKLCDRVYQLLLNDLTIQRDRTPR